MVCFKNHSTTLILLFWLNLALGQFAPQAGLPGSTAVPASDAEIKFWAELAIIQRGYLNKSDTNFSINGNNRATFGDIVNVYGPPGGTTDVVSLGDSGVITVRFAVDIADGPGWDFAVFENGFRHPSDSNLAFCELAFVEVSSDGQHFYRFDAVSLTQTNTQIGPFDFLDARNIHNLAGKYIAGYGTPFDLDELSYDPRYFDPQHVKYVRLIDVVGSIDSATGSFDSQGNLINDPFPTPFVSAGFDLDAIGVKNYSLPAEEMKIFPNPARDNITVFSQQTPITVLIYNSNGQLIKSLNANDNFIRITVKNLPNGIYFCLLKSNNKIIFGKFIKI